MKKIISLFFICWLLSACTLLRSQDDLFKQRQVCWSYKADIEKKVLLENQRNNKSEYNKNRIDALEQIFYSPKHQTCFFVVTTEYQNVPGFSVSGKRLYEYGDDIYYSVSKEKCWISQSDFKEQVNTCVEFDKKIQNMKE